MNQACKGSSEARTIMKKQGKRIGEMSWGRRLAGVLKEKKISQKEAARAAKISPSVLNGWLQGASPNDFAKVKELADHLEVSFTWLLTGMDDNHKAVLSLDDLFDHEDYFEGHVKIRIERLTPKKR